MMMALIALMMGLGALHLLGGFARKEGCEHQFVIFSSNAYGTHRSAEYECERCGAKLTGRA